MLKKAKAKLAAGEADAGSDAAKDTAKEMAQARARFVAPDLACRPRRVLAGEAGRREAVRDAGEAGRAVAGQDQAGRDRNGGRGARRRDGKAKEMQQMAGGTWDKLEQVFEDRVARALSKLGVYTQNDVQRLAARVDELADAVNKLMKAAAGGSAARSRSKRARPRKTARAAAAPAKRRPKKRAPK